MPALDFDRCRASLARRPRAAALHRLTQHRHLTALTLLHWPVFPGKEHRMAQKLPQTYENHTRWDPLFHFFLLPIFGLGLVLALIHFFAHIRQGDFRDNFHAFLLILLAVALLTAVFKIRLYALKLQDRIIRMEERLRL